MSDFIFVNPIPKCLGNSKRTCPVTIVAGQVKYLLIKSLVVINNQKQTNGYLLFFHQRCILRAPCALSFNNIEPFLFLWKISFWGCHISFHILVDTSFHLIRSIICIIFQIKVSEKVDKHVFTEFGLIVPKWAYSDGQALQIDSKKVWK